MNASDTFSYGRTLQSRVARERLWIKSDNAVWDDHAGQARTVLEIKYVNGNNTVRDEHTGQAFIVPKSTRINSGHFSRDGRSAVGTFVSQKDKDAGIFFVFCITKLAIRLHPA